MADNHEYVITRIQYRLSAIAAGAAIVVGAVFYHVVEHWRWLDAVYFCIVTLTTVGYGDITPKTDAGKVFTIGYILLGIGIITTFIQAVARNHIARRTYRVSQRKRGRM